MAQWPMTTASRKTSLKVAGVLLVLATTIPAGFIARDWVGRRQRLARLAAHPESAIASCANHAIQLKFLVLSFIENNNFFPHEKDARKSFARMNQSGQLPEGFFASFGAACPESFQRDRSIGYIFVADGLSTKSAVAASALVFFCPADSHQGPNQHCHATFADGMRCLESNATMIETLRAELVKGRTGVVAYSTNALAVMAMELAARENHAR
jgi:hypothetical protein